jgi:hypothetical protein
LFGADIFIGPMVADFGWYGIIRLVLDIDLGLFVIQVEDRPKKQFDLSKRSDAIKGKTHAMINYQNILGFGRGINILIDV